MAITKIHAVKATVHKAIDYICNPQKTDESILISSFGCSPQTAAYDFKFALSRTNPSDPNKAFHLIQAFMPGEVSYEEAHRIGTELADKLLEGKFSYVVATHIDKGHVHNHIIFCAADNINHEKYHDCKQSYRHIRQLNDRLCKEHGLSVPPPSNSRGKTYREWLSDKQGSSWKTRLKCHIDEAIQQAQNYEDFCSLIRAKGYEIKGENFGEDSHKFIAFRPLDKERFVRGCEKSLGAEYTKERIKERIEEKALNRTKKRAALPVRKKPMVKDYAEKNLIDTTGEKFSQSPGLKHWADIQNLKIASASYSAAGSIAELKKQLTAKSTLAKTARKSLVETERQLKDLGLILNYANQYKENRIYHIRYLKSKDQDAYLRRHETELLLYDGAENMLRRFGISTKDLNVEDLKRDFSALSAKKQSLRQTCKAAEKEAASLQHKLDNLDLYLKQEALQQANEKSARSPDKCTGTPDL